MFFGHKYNSLTLILYGSLAGQSSRPSPRLQPDGLTRNALNATSLSLWPFRGIQARPAGLSLSCLLCYQMKETQFSLTGESFFRKWWVYLDKRSFCFCYQSISVCVLWWLCGNRFTSPSENTELCFHTHVVLERVLLLWKLHFQNFYINMENPELFLTNCCNSVFLETVKTDFLTIRRKMWDKWSVLGWHLLGSHRI